MSDRCTRCEQVKSLGSLVWLTNGWGGRRTELVCLGCKKDGEQYDSASD